MSKLWLQFSFYALSLGISLVLNVWQPQLLDLACTPLPVRGMLDPQRLLPNYSATPNQSSGDREK